MESLKIEKYEFITETIGDAHFVFSTAKGELNFNKSLQAGVENLENLKQMFSLKEIGYLEQIHSDLIYNYNGVVHQGDALITNKKAIGIGVFTADCVPVLIYDEKLKVAAAVHSGWKGTSLCIVSKTIDKMRQEYGCNTRNLVVYIGPHNQNCCYEVGEELIEKFQENALYKDQNIFSDRLLDLKKCIELQLKNKGIQEEQIHALNICTFCNKEYKLYSYRKNAENYGRMFSFIFIDE